MGKPKEQLAIRLETFRILEVGFESKKALSKNFQEDLTVDIDYSIGFGKGKKSYSVHFFLHVFHEELAFDLEVESIGIFSTNVEITESTKESPFLTMNSPAIAFPFLRSFVTTFTASCGLNPIILPTYNFT